MREEDEPIFLWMYYHLMREAEACALQWQDWNEDNQVFTVRRSISARKVVESTKTSKIYITPCHSDFIPYMKMLKMKGPHKGTDFIFQNKRARKEGSRHINESINKAWKRAYKTVGKIRPIAQIKRHLSFFAQHLGCDLLYKSFGLVNND